MGAVKILPGPCDQSLSAAPDTLQAPEIAITDKRGDGLSTGLKANAPVEPRWRSSLRVQKAISPVFWRKQVRSAKGTKGVRADS